MKEFINQLLGEHTVAIWTAGILWALIGIFAFKLFVVVKKSWSDPDFLKNFRWKVWFNENVLDIVFGVLLALIILRLGDYTFELANKKFGYDWGRPEDFVAFMIPISAFIQWQLHKRRPVISKSVER